jgi:hypothetical protein
MGALTPIKDDRSNRPPHRAACYFRSPMSRAQALILTIALFATSARAQIVTNWDPKPFVTDSALVFHDDLDFYLNSYSKQEIKAMRRMVSIWRMNFDKVIRATINDIRTHSEGSGVATRTKDFELPIAQTGKTYRLSDDAGKVRVFMFGSITNPPARFQLPLWEALQQKFDTNQVRLFMIYGRELHPGDQKTYRDYPAPKSEHEKLAYAQELGNTVRIPVLVDGLNDAVSDLYGRAPNAAYVVDKDGTLIFRGTWADSRKIEHILTTLMRWYAEGKPKRFSLN